MRFVESGGTGGEGVAGGAGDFGQSEVEDFGVTPLGDENIGRLDVAVDDALDVGGVKSVAISMASATSVSVSRGRPVIMCLRVTPSRYSMAMKRLPACSPIS